MSDMVELITKTIYECADLSGEFSINEARLAAHAIIKAIREKGAPCGGCGCPVYPIDEKVEA